MGAMQMVTVGGESQISLSNQTLSETNPGTPAFVAYTINTSGAVEQTTALGGTTTLEAWATPAGFSANYEARATLNSGTLASGTTGSWLACTGSPSWSVSQGSTGSQAANLTIEIRNASTLVVKASCTVSLAATVV